MIDDVKPLQAVFFQQGRLRYQLLEKLAFQFSIFFIANNCRLIFVFELPIGCNIIISFNFYPIL